MVARTRGVQPWRRVFHAASGVCLALAPGWLGLSFATTALLLAGLTGILLFVDVVRLRSPVWNRWFFRLLPLLASPREARGIASSTWFAAAAAAVWGGMPGPPAVAGLLVLGLADPAASVVGRLWGRRPFGKGTREGSLAFVTVAAVVLAMVVGWPLALPVALGVAVVEVLPLGLDDNLTVPVATAVAVWALSGPWATALVG